MSKKTINFFGTKFPIIEVTWRDSAIYDAEFDSEWPFEICTLNTIGYLVKETEKEILVVREYRIRNGEEVRYRGSVLIPKENIVSRRNQLPRGSVPR